MLFTPLGQVEVRDDTNGIVCMAPKAKALLAVLLLDNAKEMHNDEIMDLMWGDQDRSVLTAAVLMSASDVDGIAPRRD